MLPFLAFLVEVCDLLIVDIQEKVESLWLFFFAQEFNLAGFYLRVRFVCLVFKLLQDLTVSIVLCQNLVDERISKEVEGSLACVLRLELGR